MKVLVTGGAGYVGSHCVKLLCERGHDVVVVDDLSAGHGQAVHTKAELIRGDAGDEVLLGELLAGRQFDGAIHFAAYLVVSESVSQPLKYFHNNVGKTILLLKALKEGGVRRLVFSSSCATYGVPQSLPVAESQRQEPVSPYGASKLMVERILKDCAVAWGLGSVSLRYFNAAGCAADGSIGEDHDPEIHLIPRALLVALGKIDKLQVYGTDYPTPDGTCLRDYVHVDDLAEAHLLTLERIEASEALAYNVGVGRGYSVREVIEAVEQVCGKRLAVEQGSRRAGDPPALYADADKIRRELGWRPRFDGIEQIVQTAWRWFSAHPNGYGEGD